MRVNEDSIVFECLSAVSAVTIGESVPVTAKKPASFVSSNAKGDSKDTDLERIEQLGKSAAVKFNSIFA